MFDLWGVYYIDGGSNVSYEFEIFGVSVIRFRVINVIDISNFFYNEIN